MIKNKMGGILTCCDRCDAILATNFNYLSQVIHWERVETPRKGREGHTRNYDFCDEECRIIYFRGRAYMRRKNFYRERNNAEIGSVV